MFENDYRLYEIRNPNYWGPKFWSVLYLGVLGFPYSLSNEQQAAIKNLLQQFHIFLPCEECRQNFIKETRNLQWRNFATRESALREILQIHNSVRRRLGKHQFELRDLLQHFYKDMTSNNDILKIYFIAVLIILLILLNKCTS